VKQKEEEEKKKEGLTDEQGGQFVGYFRSELFIAVSTEDELERQVRLECTETQAFQKCELCRLATLHSADTSSSAKAASVLNNLLLSYLAPAQITWQREEKAGEVSFILV
jgi:hypothetical protein